MTNGRNGAPALPFPPQLFQRMLIRELPQQTITFGGTDVRFELEQVGFSPGLIVLVTAQYDVAAGGSALAARGPYAIISRFRVQPPGPQPIISTSGWAMHLHNLLEKSINPFTQGAVARVLPYGDLNDVPRNTFADPSWPRAAGVLNQIGQLWYFLPFTRSAYDPKGLLPLGNSTRTVLYVTPGATADVWATGANITSDSITVRVFQLILTSPPPRPDVSPVDLSWVITYEEQDQPVSATGNNDVRIDPHDTLLGVIHTFVNNNGLDSTDISDATLRFDQTFIHTATPRILVDALQQWKVGRAFPLGLVVYDFDELADADGSVPVVLRGDAAVPYALSIAPWVHTDQIATILSRVTIAAGATLTNARLFTAIRRLARVVG